MKVHSLLAVVAAFLSFADAGWYLPEVTASVQLASNGVTPRPTQPAFLDDYLRVRALDDNEESDSPTVFIAPDATCGYISGRAGIAYTCYTDYSCVFLTASAREQGHVACCDSQNCNIRKDCVDNEQYSSQSLCDSGCDQDIYTLKCTDASAPYCNTLSFTSNIIDYWCNSRNFSSVQPAFTTFIGETNGHSFSPYVITSTSLSPTGSALSAQPTVNDAGSTTTGSSSSSTADSDNSDGGGSSTPVGGIVGGVVGGVAGVGLIGVAAWYFLRRRRLNAQKAASVQGDPHGGYQSPQMQSSLPAGGYAAVPQGHPTSYYDPKTASLYGQPQQGGYYAPGQGPTPDGSQPYQQSVTPSQFTNSASDPRMSQAGSSPEPPYGAYGAPQGGQPGYQGPQQGVIHEAPGPGMNQGGETHEMA